MSGVFISFEGLDGSGKTTIIEKLSEYFNNRKLDYLVTREPGGNHISEAIRDLILSKDSVDMDARTEALLYAASRRQHLVETVYPALRVGKLVLSDRYIDSSVAYQGAGRDIGTKQIWDLNEFATEGLMPELTIYFEISPKIGLSRIHTQRNNEVNRLDEEQLQFYNAVHEQYLRIAHDEPNRVKVVDASQPVEEVYQQVVKILDNFFEAREG